MNIEWWSRRSLLPCPKRNSCSLNPSTSDPIMRRSLCRPQSPSVAPPSACIYLHCSSSSRHSLPTSKGFLGNHLGIKLSYAPRRTDVQKGAKSSRKPSKVKSSARMTQYQYQTFSTCTKLHCTTQDCKTYVHLTAFRRQ